MQDMEITIPIKIRLTESEWAKLRDDLRSNGNHSIWNKIVEDWKRTQEKTDNH